MRSARLTVCFGGSYGTFGLVAAIGVAVVYWLKYSGSNINWPMPVQTMRMNAFAVTGGSDVHVATAVGPIVVVGQVVVV